MRTISGWRGLTGDERGLVGIGTLIIFIALIIVAAVAAGTIIRTSGELREQARKTGEESIRQVSAGVRVVSSKGRVGGGENVENVEVMVKLRAGSAGINFEDMTLDYMSSDVEIPLFLGKNENENNSLMVFESRNELYNQWRWLDENEFAVVKVLYRGAGTVPHILGESGSTAEVWINTEKIENIAGGALQEEEEATVILAPKVGVETRTTLIVPPSLTQRKIVEL